MTGRFPEEHRKGQLFAVKFFWFLQVLSKIGILKLLAVFKIFPGFSKTITYILRTRRWLLIQ